jgi:Zn-dependent metalloprotease
VKKLVVGGATAALVSALAVLAPTGATAEQAARTHHPDARTAAATAAARLVAARPGTLRASRHDAFVAGRVISSGGLQYVPYERTYRGLPVVGGDFVVATDHTGKVLATSVAQTRKVRLADVRASVSRGTARATSTRLVQRATTGASRLVVLQRGSSRLAWETWVTGRRHGEPSRLTVYVDARTGRVLTTKEHVLAGTGSGGWEGSVSLPTTQTGSTYSMTNTNASSLACQNASGNATFTGPDDAWGDGNPATRETGCVDAFYASEMERQMLAAWDGRNGMNGSGGWVPTRVGLNDLNAYYDGTQVQIGHNTANQWIGSIDVVAHEYGHGVDDKTPGGISGKGTQEFVADTFGAATEWYAANPADAPDYTVGEEVNLVGNGPIRYMYNPSLAGDANCYSNKVAAGEVHAAAGPGNHWFYLVAEGSRPTNGQPTSPTCNGATVTGLGIQKAERIMYNAMLLKTSRSSYLTYRTWTLTAAKNLFPGSCTEFNTVKAAWDAVSVPAQKGDPSC